MAHQLRAAEFGVDVTSVCGRGTNASLLIPLTTDEIRPAWLTEVLDAGGASDHRPRTTIMTGRELIMTPGGRMAERHAA
jgi:hypothetical protein